MLKLVRQLLRVGLERICQLQLLVLLLLLTCTWQNVVVEQLQVPDKILGPVGAAAVLVPEHLVLGAEHFPAQGAGRRRRDVNVGDVRSELPEGLVADVADAAVAGHGDASKVGSHGNGIRTQASSASTRISADPTNQTTNPGDLSHSQTANNNTA